MDEKQTGQRGEMNEEGEVGNERRKNSKEERRDIWRGEGMLRRGGRNMRERKRDGGKGKRLEER